ncbi:protocatechuate 4,5-dioxygenase subunit alpha [Streptomyces sp. R302]|uniref:protocatechuate 4,5-dioxygenase subunit alpha n=1 Tax=unclassified Streptomyces TaxID=2593676 RepID=UPI00145CA72E|nr:MULTISPECIES: protocatechuate 4,5-dioxygenase subunit alpha [unclassified Streptomyces]NML51835.1 protocatechuate 4,5-dioxygenase subunit alpha [Streptomyces sp. R301]NML81455.1 protocatechuate 4,5-dioxygenase subunit alpha [Streptomyces sp. R302]
MPLDKTYKLVPGTTIFDAEQSARGYHLNQFCMSLMTAENRAAYLADERAYLDAWPLREEQKRALLDRDLNAAVREGGNIYFLAKWGATLGFSFQQMAGSMTGMTEEEYRAMMAGGGRSVEGNRIDHAVLEAAHAPTAPSGRATVTGAVFTSHVPAIGAAMDHGKTEEPYWRPVFEGYERSRAWQRENVPDVVVLVYNDHASAFDQSLVPTFVLGTGASFPVADEGYGPRPVPAVEGDPDLAAHLAHSLIRDDFDLTLANEMTVDHGLTVPLSLMFGDVEKWPCKVIPFHVNVVQYPVPSGARCFRLGQALRKAIESYDRPVEVQVWGTGGMSHQLQGPRAGLINRAWDNAFLDRLVEDPAGLAEVPHLEYVEEAGSEGIELVMWLIARGALSDVDGSGEVAVEHRFYHVPASNTAVGHLILDNRPRAEEPAEKE